MPKLHSHRVKLVGVDGQEQAVIFDIEAEGVHLLTKNAQVSPAFQQRLAAWCGHVCAHITYVRLDQQSDIRLCSILRGSLLR